jgi:OOP family OmpA-OmpF porin
MKLSRSARLAALAMCATLGMTVTAGCSQLGEAFSGEKSTFECPQPAHPGLAIAVGARANSPTPAPPAEVRKLIADTMQGCGKITVVRVDGRPSVAGERVFLPTAETQQKFDIQQAKFLEDVAALMTTAAKALVAEANVLGALSVASGAAGQGGTVVLIDSGVQTTDPMDLRTSNLPAKKPQVIADALRRDKLLPDLTGRTVVLSGIGYTAAPQNPLDDRNRNFLRDLWREIVIAAGVKDPVVLPDPNTNPAVQTNPSVGVVTFPAGAILLECNTDSTLPDNGEVGFIPDQAEFRNPDAARAVLKGLVGFLTANSRAVVEIKGYVAHYGSGDLSQRRADRVKQELVSLGARNTMTAKGMGWGPHPNPTAPPDERYDQLNRQVVVSISCP